MSMGIAGIRRLLSDAQAFMGALAVNKDQAGEPIQALILRGEAQQIGGILCRLAEVKDVKE